MPAVPQVETFAEVAQDSIQHITHDCVYNNRVFIYIYIYLFIYTYMAYIGFAFIGLFPPALLSPLSRQEITRAFPTNPWLPTCRCHGGGDQNAVKVIGWMMFFVQCFLGFR